MPVHVSFQESVVKVDLHVHTAMYSRCSRIDPAQVVPAAVGSGLDVVVITEHNIPWPRRKFDIFRNDKMLVLNGVEVTAADGHDYLVIGDELTGFYAGMEPELLSRRAADNGAALIFAHPFRFDLEVPRHVPAMCLAAIEVCSNNMCGAHERVLADGLVRRMGVAAVSSSDAHITAAIGAHFTTTKRPVYNVEDLVKCLNAGEVEPLAMPGGPRVVYDHVRKCQLDRIRKAIERGVQGLENIKAATGAPLDVIRTFISS